MSACNLNSVEKMYQVSTLNALALGYTRTVVRVSDLLQNGDTGLGTFENCDGEMIVVDGHCYRAADDGSVSETPADLGVPFASVVFLKNQELFAVGAVGNIDSLKALLNVKIEEHFGLNSMHMVRIDGFFKKVNARSESGVKAHHIELKEILFERQKSFEFDHIAGSLVCLYYPDYMEGINAAGWHFHFVSDDKRFGGHVFDLSLEKGEVRMEKITSIELQLPREAAFDTYSLTKASQKDIKQVEQGNK
jgi:acetolactate decarboxylase